MSDELNPRARKILLAAAELFVRKGFHQTSTRDIAKAAQVSLGNLYNHFPTKTELILRIAVLEREELSPMLELLADTDDEPKAMLARFADAYFEWSMLPENVALEAEITAELLRNPKGGEAFAANRQLVEDALARVVKRITDRELPPFQIGLIVDLISCSAQRACFAPKSEGKAIRSAMHSSIQAILGA